MKSLAAFLFALLLLPTLAFAQGAVQQTGPVTPGNMAIWAQDHLVKDGGPVPPLGGSGGGGASMTSTVTADGVTDVTAAMNSEMAAFAAAGGGTYYLTSGQYAVGGSGNLNIPHAVRVACSLPAGGYVPNNAYLTAPCTIILNPAATIMGAATPGTLSGLYNVRIVRKGYSAPLTLRQSLTEIANYAGTAVTCPNGGTDFDVYGVLIVGFNYSLISWCDRLRFSDSRFDTVNGFQLQQCYDTCFLKDVEAWPFGAGNPYTTGPQAQTSNIAGAANNGSGLIRLTLSTAPSTPVVTGDTVVVGGVGGVPNAAGRWTATAISPTLIDLQGSTWAGTYTSGGTARISAMRRTGKAFDIIGPGGGPFMIRLTDFGHDVGLHYGASVDTVDCLQCWLDNDQPQTNFTGNTDPVPIGLLVDGNASHGRFRGGYINSPGSSVTINSTGDSPLFMTDSLVIAGGWASGVYPINLINGTWFVTGSNIENIDPTRNLMNVSSAFGLRKFSSTNIPGGIITAPPSACANGIQDGATGPCPITIGMAGDSVAGSPTYQSQVGEFQQTGLYVTVSFSVQITATGGMAGNLVLTGLPSSSSNTLDRGTCYFGIYFGLTAQPGYTSFTGVIQPVSNKIQVWQNRTDGVGGAQLPLSQVAANSAISGYCSYHL